MSLTTDVLTASQEITVEESRQARRPVKRATDPGADLREPEIADAEQQENAQHQVVQVHAPDDDIMERTLSRMDRVGDRPHDGEGQEEGDRREERPLPAGIGKKCSR